MIIPGGVPVRPPLVKVLPAPRSTGPLLPRDVRDAAGEARRLAAS
jgi:hypothetical protein